MEQLAVSGFEINGHVHEGGTFRLLRARRLRDGREVCLKTTVSPYPDPRSLAQLKNEYAIGEKLKGDSFPEYLELITEGNRVFVVIQQLRGDNLEIYLRSNEPGERKMLDIGIAVCEILRDLEANQVIHKDFKPENLVLDHKTGRVYLVDFGLSINNVRSERKSLPPDDLEGTPAYLSPEQTGKTSWTLDHRTDFYAFGCCLYRFFTGRLPFESEDPLELLHYQMALSPTPPIRLNGRIPAPLSDLILKLLAKSPPERYQTAEGIYQDLLRIRDDWDRPAILAEFKIGLRDVPTQVYFSQQIFGREKEIERMNAAFRAVETGQKRVLMIGGGPGLGKTELVHAFRNQLPDGGFQFAAGGFSDKLDDFSRSGFTGMMRQYLQGLLALDEHKLAHWRDRIAQYVDGNLPLLATILPELSLICEAQDAPGELSGKEERNRYFYAMVSLVRALQTEGKPWLLFLDDLHLADAPTFRLLEELAFGTDSEGMLLIGCYRSGQALDDRPLPESLERLRKSGLAEIMDLLPPGKAATEELVVSAIGDNPRAGVLAEFLFGRTDGVPLLQHQLLRLVQEQGLFHYHASGGYWDFDPQDLQRLPLGHDFAELLRERAAVLPRATVEVLSTAAVLGFHFSRQVLVELAGLAEPEVDRALLRATGKGIVISIDSVDPSLPFPQDFKFTHASLHQHFYSLRDPEARQRLHLRIGELFLDLSGGFSERNPLAYDILVHLNEVVDLLQDREVRRDLGRLNHLRAKEARQAGRYEQAIAYYNAALRIFDQEPDLIPADERFGLAFQRAQTQFLGGQHQKAEAGFVRLMEEGRGPDYLDVVGAYFQLLIAEGRHEDVLALGQKALARSKVARPLPMGNSAIKFSLLRGMIGLRMRMRGNRIDRIPQLHACTNAEAVQIIQLYRDLGISALSINPALFGVVVIREVELTLKYGLHTYAATAFVSYAIMTCIGMRDYKMALRLKELGDTVHEQMNAGVEFPEITYAHLHFLMHLHLPVREHLGEYLANYEKFLQVGNPVFAGYAVNSRIWSMVCLGIPLDEVRDEMQGYIRSFEMKGEEEGVDMMMPRLQFIMGLQGAFPEPWKLRHGQYDFESKFASLEARGSLAVLGGMVIARLQLCWMFRQWEEGLEVIARGDRFISNMEGMLFVADYYLYHSLVIASHSLAVQQSPSASARRRMKALHKVTEKLMKQQPENYAAHFALMEAARLAIHGPRVRALDQLKSAIALARKYKFSPNFAAASELAFLWDDGHLPAEERHRYLFDAHQAWLLWGATAKAAQLEAAHPNEFAQKEVVRSSFSGSLTLPSDAGSMDLQSILKASTVIAREIRLPQLLSTLVRVLVENAGAEKGCFILQTNGKLSLEVVGELKNGSFVAHSPGSEDAHPGQGNRHSRRGLDETLVPASAIRYVARTGKGLALTAQDEAGHFQKDPYLMAHQPQSVLCHPVNYQGNLIGIVYLESRQVSQSFNASRMEILSLLSGQIGISLQNALLYEELEDKVKERTQTIEAQKLEIEQEQRRTDELLRNILPDAVVRELKEQGKTTPRRFERVSILFSDIVGFTRFAEQRSPEKLVHDLDRYFGAVDAIIERFGLEKVKTIGDAYLCVGGLDGHPEDIHARTVRAGLAMLELVEWQKQEGLEFDIRIGIHTGPVVAGVVGTKKFAYDIWGDSVNIAARMESSGAPGRINVSRATRDLLGDSFAFEPRGSVAAKNKGGLEMYFVGIAQEGKLEG